MRARVTRDVIVARTASVCLLQSLHLAWFDFCAAYEVSSPRGQLSVVRQDECDRTIGSTHRADRAETRPTDLAIDSHP